jgi:hypothetical protein
MTTAAAVVRPRHLLSAFASGAFAGLLANVAFAMVPVWVLAVAGTPVRPPELDSDRTFLAAVVGAILVGLFYVHTLVWLPRALLARSAVFAVLGAPVIAGLKASAYVLPGTTLSEPLVGWIAASTVGTSLATPILLHFVLYAMVRSFSSPAALPVNLSLFLLGVVAVSGPIQNAAAMGEVLAVAPAGIATIVTLVIALATLTWTLGIRPEDERPQWFRPVGRLLIGLTSLTGVAMLVGVIVR